MYVTVVSLRIYNLYITKSFSGTAIVTGYNSGLGGILQCYTKCLHKVIVLGGLLSKRSTETHQFNHS